MEGMGLPMEIWEVWYPNAAAQGLLFARGRMDHHDTILVHATPDSLRVEVRDDDGNRLAFADQLTREGDALPMTRLRRIGSTIVREDGWPVAADNGRPVLLAGGEIGILQQWWNADDGSEWRWRVEFYNHR